LACEGPESWNRSIGYGGIWEQAIRNFGSFDTSPGNLAPDEKLSG